jgi:fumarylacetoacetase
MTESHTLDETHDPARRSFVEAANRADTDFPIQNLPLGIFSTETDPIPRVGVAIGDQVFDLKKASRSSERLPQSIRDALQESSLNSLFSLGLVAMRDVRCTVADMLDQRDTGNEVRRYAADLLTPMGECTFHLPTRVSNYTDFYAGIYHARAAGALLTPENPLPANYKWVPIAYHGRASSVQVGQGAVRRPLGQRPPTTPGAPPSFGPCERLDFELEMGFYLASGNQLGKPIPISEASQGIAGFSLLNDWSARDLQRWEMTRSDPSSAKALRPRFRPGSLRRTRWRPSASRLCCARRAIRVRSITFSTPRTRKTGDSTFISESCCRPQRCGLRASLRWKFSPRTRNISTGRPRRWSRITR